MKKTLLLTPGPTQIPADLCAALGRPIIHHRTPQFQQVLKEVQQGLQYVLGTQSDVYLLACSGTGTMEAAVCNLVSPGDKVITVEGGKFGERWTELCQVYGGDIRVVKVTWGKAAQAKQIKDLLDKEPDIKAVFVTLNETSTAVSTNIQAIAEVTRKTDAVLVVDAISGLGAMELKMDEWGADVVASASHKGFMLPPGLGFVAVNEKAFKLVERCASPRYYFDFRKSKKALAQTDTPFTPAIGIIIALAESLKKFREAGLDKMLAEYARLAQATRAAGQALGMEAFPDAECCSSALSALRVPAGVDGEKLVKIMRDTYGVTMAGGQDELKGKVVRIAHMGAIDEFDLLAGIGCLEKVLKQLGHKFAMGAGVKAAQEVLNA
ncbi:MAG: alanine--glyoxylate aminotransferase family protein [Candidatus Omnitrophica bacterium]|nr:alanine--glyoxylate aminotransferase family protein [Candidatus Omnitrophota bacterium]